MSEPFKSKSEFVLGERVYHKTFGSGTVVSISTEETLVKIEFDSNFTRLLDWRFANLSGSPHQPEPLQSFEKPWKPQLSELLSRVSGLEVISYGYKDYGRKAQPETISVIVNESAQTGTKPDLSNCVSGNHNAILRARDYLQEIRTSLPDSFVAFIGTSRWRPPLYDSRSDDAKKPEKPMKSMGVSDWLAVLVGDIRPVQERLPQSIEIAQRVMNPRTGVELAIGPGKSQFDILRLAGTSAGNYRLSTEAMVDKLQHFDEEYGINILGANTDSITFQLKRCPDDAPRMVKELFEFCPDLSSVDEVESMASRIASGKTLIDLWWD